MLSLPCFEDGSDGILAYLHVELSHETSLGRRLVSGNSVLIMASTMKTRCFGLILLWVPVEVILAKS